MTFAIDIRHWKDAAGLREHLTHYDPAIAPWASGVTIHHTVSPTIVQWKGRASIESMAAYYEHTNGWSAGPHLFVCAGARNASDDGIWQMTPLNMPGVHAGVCNAHLWGIEVVGYYDRVRWSTKTAELAYGAAAALLAWRDIVVSKQTVKGHRECKSLKTCPGSAIDMNIVRATLAIVMAAPVATPPPAPPAPPAPSDAPYYSADSPILGTPYILLERWIAAFQRHSTGDYTPADIEVILRAYDSQAEAAGVNRDLALAQLAYETDWLSSYWSQRPRRNPAGIGVTGAPGAGISFGGWLTESIPAHLGRLLAYALPEHTGTRPQQRLIHYALDVRSLPPAYRGAGATLAGLDGLWAADGYGAQVAARANEVAE